MVDDDYDPQIRIILKGTYYTLMFLYFISYK